MRKIYGLLVLAALNSMVQPAIAKSIWDGLNETAPRSVFDQLRDTAPRSVFEEISDSAPVQAPETSPHDLAGE